MNRNGDGLDGDAACPPAESELCQKLFNDPRVIHSAAKEAALAFCIQAIKTIPRSNVVFASAIWVIYRDELYKPRSFDAFALQEFKLKKENAHKQKRYGRLVEALCDKYGPLLWPSTEHGEQPGPLKWPKPPRLPQSEREARSFAATQYTTAEQVRGWDFAVWLMGPKPIPEAKAKAIMDSVRRRSRPPLAPSPSSAIQQGQEPRQFLKHALCAGQVAAALLSVIISARFGAGLLSVISLCATLALIAITAAVLPKAYRSPRAVRS